eukprot:4855059-Amphidinium_carterae.1
MDEEDEAKIQACTFLRHAPAVMIKPAGPAPSAIQDMTVQMHCSNSFHVLTMHGLASRRCPCPLP